MPFETTVRAFAAALGEPSAPPPAMTHGRLGAPDARRFAVYRNNVAVGLIGALEARYPVSRRIAGDELFRAMARAFVHRHKPRSPVMIAYGEEFPEFVADYLARGPERFGRVSSPRARPKDGRIASARSSPVRGRIKEGGRAVRCDKGAAAHPIISSARATPHPYPPPQDGAGALTASILPEYNILPPASPTSRGSRTPGSRPITPKTRAWRPSASSPRSARIRCQTRGSPFIPRRGSCASRRPPQPSGPRLRARTVRSRLPRGPAKTRSSRVPTATSACACCRRLLMISL